MYGGRFKQQYGWYINQAWLRLGVSQNSQSILSDIAPEGIKELVAEAEECEQIIETLRSPPPPKWLEMLVGTRGLIRLGFLPVVGNLPGIRNIREFKSRRHADKAKELTKRSRDLRRKVSNTVENSARQEFGFRKIGEGWVSETMLFQIVERLWPDAEVLRHHRPDWLEGLELDLFLPDSGLAFEYQGQQHFHPVKAWGGESAFNSIQHRDKKKAEMCKKKGVVLITIDYTEALTEEHISGRIESSGFRPPSSDRAT